MTELLGRFGHHPNPAIDFCQEVESLESMGQDRRLGLEMHTSLESRIARALDFHVGADIGAIYAKHSLRELDRQVRAGAIKPLSYPVETASIQSRRTGPNMTRIELARKMLRAYEDGKGPPIERMLAALALAEALIPQPINGDAERPRVSIEDRQTYGCPGCNAMPQYGEQHAPDCSEGAPSAAPSDLATTASVERPLTNPENRQLIEALNKFRRFVDLIETRAQAVDGPVEPFLDELNHSSDAEKKNFTEILAAVYRSSEALEAAQKAFSHNDG